MGAFREWTGWISRYLGLVQAMAPGHHSRAVPRRVCSPCALTQFCKLTRSRHRLRRATVTPPGRACARDPTYTLRASAIHPSTHPHIPSQSPSRLLAPSSCLLLPSSLSRFERTTPTQPWAASTRKFGLSQVRRSLARVARRVPAMAAHPASFSAPVQVPHQASASVS